MARIPNITIDQQAAEIGIQKTPAQMHIEQERVRMKITTEMPKMEIDRKNPSFKVNRKKINSEMNLKSTPELSMVYRDKGRAGAFRGTRTAVADGNFLGNVRNPGDRVGQLARNKKMSAIMRKKETNIGLMPKSTPEIEWDKGSMQINWTKHSIVIDWDGDFMPRVTIDPRHSIEIFLRTAPYFRILIEDAEDPTMPGSLVDEAV